jgi:transposase
MPWKECSVMDEKIKFIARLLDGESMTSLCEEYGISRKTGYRIFGRYEECGLEAFVDRTRRPVRFANQLPLQIEKLILRIKDEKPSWGARKIRDRLIRKYPDINPPANSTIHATLDRNGLVKKNKRKRYKAKGTL